MIPSRQSLPEWMNRRLAMLMLAVGAAGILAIAANPFGSEHAQPLRPVALSAPVPMPAASSSAASDSGGWMNLSAFQRATLLPLKAAWPGLDPVNRRRWLEVAERMRSRSPGARERVRMRMVEWAKLSPAKRAQARLQYVYAKRVPTAKRKELWSEYQASAAASAPKGKSWTGPSMVAPALAQVKPGATTVPVTQLLRPAPVELEVGPRQPG